MASSRRSKTHIELVGFENETLGTTTRLPTARQVLCKFFYHVRTDKKKTREAAKLTLAAVEELWSKARVPTRASQHAIATLERYYDDWKTLMKHKDRKTKAHCEKELSFSNNLDSLFDIAHKDALALIKIPEDRDFLISQRQNTNKGYMGKEDEALAKREKRAQERAEAELYRKRKFEEERAKFDEKVVYDSTEEHDDEVVAGPSGYSTPNLGHDSDHEANNLTPKEGKRPKRCVSVPKINFITPELASVLDRTGISDRNATMILAATVKALGLDLEMYAVNKTSVRNARIQCRVKMSESLRASYTPPQKCTLHWDGKLMRDLTGTDRVDRLPVIVTAAETSQLLGVPKLQTGSGKEQATAVADLVQNWNLIDNVCALSFDTTSSNTGRLNGACVILEMLLEKGFLYLPCRHHILELILGAIFGSCLGPSTGPEILLFKRFREFWKYIDFKNVSSLKDQPDVWDIVRTCSNEIALFAREQLEAFQPRDDYGELLELILIFIGEKSTEDYTFKAPGPYSLARWMAKAIYSLKIWIFRLQFKLSTREEKGLLNVCLFVTFVYSQSWYTARCAVSAPRNDLDLAKRLISSCEENPVFAPATKKFVRHLWYLGEENVGLAFFDESVSLSEKREMARALKENPSNDFLKRFETSDLTNLKSMTLKDLVTKSTMTFFERLDVNPDFLDSDPRDWDHMESYKKGLEAAKNLTVCNDHAERGVALAQSYNRLLTKDEEQYQFLLKCVEHHRKVVPDVKKSTLMGASVKLEI